MNYILTSSPVKKKQTLSTGYYKKCLLEAHDYVINAFNSFHSKQIFSPRNFSLNRNNTQPVTILLIKIVYWRSDLRVLRIFFW